MNEVRMSKESRFMIRLYNYIFDANDIKYIYQENNHLKIKLDDGEYLDICCHSSNEVSDIIEILNEYAITINLSYPAFSSEED